MQNTQAETSLQRRGAIRHANRRPSERPSASSSTPSVTFAHEPIPDRSGSADRFFGFVRETMALAYILLNRFTAGMDFCNCLLLFNEGASLGGLPIPLALFGFVYSILALFFSSDRCLSIVRRFKYGLLVWLILGFFIPTALAVATLLAQFRGATGSQIVSRSLMSIGGGFFALFFVRIAKEQYRKYFGEDSSLHETLV